MENVSNINILDSEALRELAVYCDSHIALVENIRSLESSGAVRSDVFVMTLCLEGNGTVYIDGKSHIVQANDLLIFRPGIVIEKGIISENNKYRCVVLSREYIRQMFLVPYSSGWDILQFLRETPVLSLTADEVVVFEKYYDLIRTKATLPRRSNHREVLDALIYAFVCEFRDTVERFVHIKPPVYSSGERLFKNFLEVMATSFPKERTVMAYADRLHITPKYLSSICKEFSGKTASDLINESVLKDIRFMLRRSDKTIKEIANELNFPNISFFGKYVKKHTGMSPKQYRERQQSEEA